MTVNVLRLWLFTVFKPDEYEGLPVDFPVGLHAYRKNESYQMSGEMVAVYS